jgi:5'-3' exonuclease
MLERGTTHLAVATDHVIESFRNEMWPGYKSSEGMAPELLAQFPVLELCLDALGVCVLPMTELEADDGLASAAAVAADDDRVEQVRIHTPDKDLAQCVRGTRVVQVDRRSGVVTDEEGVVAKYGVGPRSIPDWLALVGDSADGYPGLPGWGRQTAAAVLFRYGTIDAVPDQAADWDAAVRRRVRGAEKLARTLADHRQTALLFRCLATLRIERDLLGGVDDLRWHGPMPAMEEVGRLLRDTRLAERAAALGDTRSSGAPSVPGAAAGGRTGS